MKLTVLGSVVFVAAVASGLAAQGPNAANTERTIMGCVAGDGSDASPWMLAGVIIYPPAAPAPAGGGRGAGRGAGGGGGRGGGGTPAGGRPTCSRRAGRRRSRRSWRRTGGTGGTGGSTSTTSASAELQVDGHQHGAVESHASRGDRHGHQRRLQGSRRAVDVRRGLSVRTPAIDDRRSTLFGSTPCWGSNRK